MDFTDDEVARYWDENAELWAKHVRRGWDAYREHYNNPAVIPFIGDLTGREVLDAGCGEGYQTRILAWRGARMTGIDVSPRMIQLAREQQRREPLGIRFEVASFSDLSIFGDASFDDVVSFMALMDGPDLKGAAEEIFRVLRPGGEFVFSITHPCFMTEGFGWKPDKDGGEGEMKLTVARYFAQEPGVEEWRFSKGPIPEGTPPFQVPRFPRTLSEYVNVLARTGFVIRELAEPRPSKEACRGRPWLRRWRDHAPLFLYVRAVKPRSLRP